jgi:glycosyltransferase involved in cell wall biosynthesis
MKVLQVIDSGGLYGAERVVLALMDALRDSGVETALASIGEPGSSDKALETEARRQGHRVERHAMKAGPDRRGARALVTWAREQGFDILHTHGYKANTLVAGMSRSQRGLPVVATLHGWTSTRRFSRQRAYETVERLALHRAERVVAVSHAMVDRWGLKRRYQGRLSVIANGIAVPKAHSSPFPEWLEQFKAGRPAIFAAGRLSREKGFDVLIEAVGILRRKAIDVCLVVAGEGPERAALEEQVRTLGLESAVLMPGYIENAGRLVSSFDIVAIPSRTEGLPIVLLEALLSGVPVAATAVGEIPAVMDRCNAGSCVAAGDAKGMASILDFHVRRDPGSFDAAAVAAAASSAYSIDAMVDAYKSVYSRELTVE